MLPFVTPHFLLLPLSAHPPGGGLSGHTLLMASKQPPLSLSLRIAGETTALQLGTDWTSWGRGRPDAGVRLPRGAPGRGAQVLGRWAS